MTALLVGGAGILNLRDEKAPVSGITDGAFNALVRADAVDYEVFNAKIA